MTEALIALGSAFITGVLSLAGVVITNNRSNNKMQNEMKTAQAVTNEQIKELRKEVNAHNNFAQRVPVLEEKLKSVTRRVDDLERYHKPN